MGHRAWIPNITDGAVMSKLKKGLFFTDIHWGRKSNSDLHNEDCTRFIQWAADIVRSRKDIDYVGFLGDWFEHRSAVNISTLNYAYQGGCLLDELDIPVFFCVGNHDLYFRHTRDTNSLVHYKDLNNFILISEPTVVKDIVDGVFFCPYMFHNEYDKLEKMAKQSKVWAGHFEFKGFVITGTNVRMPSGPDIVDFTGPKAILSGHFHKRQQQSNVVYIGNAFPMDYGDVNDTERGVAIYDHEAHTVEFINWSECPKYSKVTASELIDGSVTLSNDSYVKCVIDVPLTYEELLVIRQTFMDQYKLREFIPEDSGSKQDTLTDTDVDDIEVTDVTSVDDLIVGMLTKINNEQLDSELLVDLYKKL